MCIRDSYLPILNPKDCPTFDLIKSGIKSVEGRKNSEKYQKYKKGDDIIFQYGRKTVKARITYIHRYRTIEDYLRRETLKRALPCVKKISDGVLIYNKWTTPSERALLYSKYGYSFLGIGIELI